MESPITQPESPLEILRRLENLARLGTVAEVRHANPPRCRVRTGQLLTAWVPWMALRAGGKRAHWWAPAVGEQCLLVSPGGELKNGVAIVGLYSDAMPPASGSPAVERTDWTAGNFMEHDSDSGTLTIRCGSAIRLEVGGASLTITAAGVFAEPDLQAGGRVSLASHVHAGVRVGPDNSGAPA